MRSLLLAGSLGILVGLCPAPSAADQGSEIFLEFPELAEWGRPVVIGGYEFWQPHPAYLPANWEPYRNGYLYEDPEEGLTWVSEDPWGFITEHYGYWRHHEVYGFVWRPLYPLQWRPYLASMFRDDGGRIIGWSPFYYDVWDHGYYVVGFGWNDYYWAPFWNRVHYFGFYGHHWHRFHGYYVSVTIYDHHRHWRRTPGPCHGRDREYRQRRDRHDPGRDGHRNLAVQTELPARRAATLRKRDAATAPNPPASRQRVDVPTGELRVPAQDTPRPSRGVSTPQRSVPSSGVRTQERRVPSPAVSPRALPSATPARESRVARERQERVQLLRDRMQSSRGSSVSTPRPSRSASPSRAVTPPATRRESAPTMPRGNLQVRESRPAATSVRRPSQPATPPAARAAPRQTAPSRPAVQAQPRPQARVGSAQQATRVERSPQAARVEKARQSLSTRRQGKRGS